MSLTKLFGSKLSLFKKDAISFVIIRRHDLGVSDDKLRYLAVRPNASIASLRRKVWHLLELPDFCEEIIVLRSQAGAEIPLAELRAGNSPQAPFVLEVWSRAPVQPQNDFSKLANMLTMGDGVSVRAADSQLTIADEPHVSEDTHTNTRSRQIPLKETMTLNSPPAPAPPYLLPSKCELACKVSTSSMFLKLAGKRGGGGGGGGADNLTSVLLKIQSDLNTLTNKMSHLETRLVEK